MNFSGGYVYLDSQLRVVAASSVAAGVSLFFEGPHPFGYLNIRRMLYAFGRVHPVTIAELVRMGNPLRGDSHFPWTILPRRYPSLILRLRASVWIGVRGFCWLAPAEQFDDASRDAEVAGGWGAWLGGGARDVASRHLSPWPHGAFVYLYDDPKHDVYFTVTQSPPTASPDARVVPFSLAQSDGRRAGGSDASSSAATGTAAAAARTAEEEEAAARSVDFTCKICMDASLKVLLQPCGHLCVCESCATMLPNSLCPICRTAVRQRVNVFL